MCRFVPIAPSSPYLTTIWCSTAGFWRLAPQSVQSRTWHRPGAVFVHRHPVSLPWSIHHLPVRRANCQLGCLDVWQKRHARTPNAPPNSELACPAAPACAPAAPLGEAISAASPVAWRAAPPGCTPAPALVGDARARAPPHPPPAYPLQRSPIRPTAPQTTPPAARSARISAAESPAPPSLHTKQNCGPCQTHTSCPGKPDRAAVAPVRLSIQASAARIPCISPQPHARTTKGTPRKEELGSRSSATARRCGIRRKKTR